MREELLLIAANLWLPNVENLKTRELIQLIKDETEDQASS